MLHKLGKTKNDNFPPNPRDPGIMDCAIACDVAGPQHRMSIFKVQRVNCKIVARFERSISLSGEQLF